jgi:hypothetical protein
LRKGEPLIGIQFGHRRNVLAQTAAAEDLAAGDFNLLQGILAIFDKLTAEFHFADAVLVAFMNPYDNFQAVTRPQHYGIIDLLIDVSVIEIVVG